MTLVADLAALRGNRLEAPHPARSEIVDYHYETLWHAPPYIPVSISPKN